MNETELYAAIWRGERNGYSQAKVTELLAHDRQLLEDLNAKRITPYSIMGAQLRNPLTTARNFLLEQIAYWERALECGGTNLSVNAVNVRIALNSQVSA
jgi:hypothetical protein